MRELLREAVLERFGLELDEATLARFEQLLKKRAPDAASARDLVEALRGEGDSEWLRTAIAAVTNGQTHFMRDAPQLAALESWLCARHAELKRPLHVWSAGCSSGEEAYTLSILGLRCRVPLAITASDLNPAAIERAQAGVYGAWALRHLPQVEHDAHFSASKAGFSVRSRVREQVRFQVHNLAVMPALVPDTPERSWDAILCRNVLIYCAGAVRARVVAGFEAVLAQGSVLLLSSSESLRNLETRLHAQAVQSAFFYVREESREAHTKVIRGPAARRLRVPARAGQVPGRPARASTPPPRVSERVRRGPTAVVQLLKRGNQHLREHAFAAATACFEQAIALDGVSFEPYLLRGVVELKQGELERAKASLRSALFLEPGCWPAEYLLAGIFAREGQLDEQHAALRRAEACLAAGASELAYASDPRGVEPLCYAREQALAVCRARLRTIKRSTGA